MSGRVLRIMSGVVLMLITVISIGLYLYSNRRELSHLMDLSISGVTALLILALAFPFFNGLINTSMFRGLGAPLSYPEGFLLAAAATLANQLPLPGGILARGVYLRLRHDLSYARYLSASVALFLCSVAVNGLIGVLLLLSAAWFDDMPVSPSLFAAYGAMAACILLFWVPVRRLPVPGRLHGWLVQAVEGWTFFARNLPLLARILAFQTVLTMLFALRYWFAFHMLSQPLSFTHAVLLSAATVLTQLVSVAPGGMGVRELIVAGIAGALGADLPASVAAVVLDRAVTTPVIIVVGWISTLLLGRRLGAR